MGFLTAAETVVLRAAAIAIAPPLPPDITRWCEENIVFDDRSPIRGPYDRTRFPFLTEIHECLSPEHPAREVTVRGSAQFGKTVSVLQPTLGAWHEYGPLDSLAVFPTTSAAQEWVNNKWQPMRRQAPSLLTVFGDGRGENKDAIMNQETVTRNGSLKVASAGSPNDLTGTSRRLIIMDDLSKWEMTDKGDPEFLAISRAEAFEEAKILRISTPLVAGTCRITKAFLRSDQRFYHVPCPHCGNMAPLTWENFRANLDPERLHAAHFTCEACGSVIQHSDKERMVRAGRWVPRHPRGDHPGFHLWRAYVPQRDWASIAVSYAQVMGWTSSAVTQATEEALKEQVEAETEQVFWNDVLGLPYEQASKGPDWTALRDRVENAADDMQPLGRGVVPARGVLLTAGVDCQGDRMEVHIVAYGPRLQRWVIDYKVIPHHIGDEAGREALNALLKTTWKTERGLRLPLDGLAIDFGAFSEDVWAWSRAHSYTRVMLVKGSSSQNGPIMLPAKLDRRSDGQARRAQKKAFLLNVSQMKADFYGWLGKEDPVERGFVRFAAALGDEYYRQITAEVRVLVRNRAGVVTSKWDLVEPTRRNEGLDTMLYSEAMARRKGWASLTDEQWARLDMERGAAPAEAQGDLFDAAVAPAAVAAPSTAKENPAPPQGEVVEQAAAKPTRKGAGRGATIKGTNWKGLR